MPYTEATIRPFASRADYAACVELQREVWGARFADIVPPTVMMISQRLGGVAAGAFDADGRLLGFVIGMTGIRHGEPVHWSDMLAVRPDARGAGLGKRLKHFQRDRLLERGVSRMQWSFDPLVARNANLNLNRLGASPVEYVVDLYGDTGSVLHAGLATDRFIVAWRLDEPAPSGGCPEAGTAPPATGAGADPGFHRAPIVDLASSAEEQPLPAAPRVRVAVPADIYAVRAADPARARGWRETQRRAFTHYLGHWYRVSGFEYHAPPADSYYLVTSEPGAASAGAFLSRPATEAHDR